MNLNSFKIGLIVFLHLCLLGFLNAQSVQVNHASGFYISELSLDFDFDPQFQLRYTLDGKNPDQSSALFEGSLMIEDRSSQQNTISNIPTNPPDSNPTLVWSAPQQNILKSTILRYALFDGMDRVSEIQQQEYFIGQAISEIKFPIASFQLDSMDLFDYETGIYIPGKDFDDDPNTWQPGNYFNRGAEWEKPALFSYFENGQRLLQQVVRFEIHGGGSRINPCKSLRIKASESLGPNRLSHKFFASRNKEEFKNLVFRNGGQEFTGAMFTDLLMHDLLRTENLEIQASSQVVVFLNGAYWGIHNLRERYDKYYFEDYHNLDKDQIDYFEIAMQYNDKEGASDDYQSMNDELQFLDLSIEENYDWIRSQIDIDNYIKHHISNAYSGGRDWAGNNERIWRPQEAGAKWRWVANDYDDGFKTYFYDAYHHAIKDDGTQWPNPEWSTRLFRSLMQNENFAIAYQSTLEAMLENEFASQRVISHIDSLYNLFSDEMPNQISRWNFPLSLEAWDNHIQTMRDFAVLRPSRLLNEFYEVFPSLLKETADIAVYPNPFRELLKLKFPLTTSCTKIRIHDAYGRFYEEMIRGEEIYKIINTSNLVNGMYVISFLNEEGEIVQQNKLLKLK